MEQYIPYSLICDLFSKNMYATPALILNWLASRLIALDLNLIPQHYPLTVCFLLYIYINLYKTLSFQLFMDLADIAFEFAPYINRTFFGTQFGFLLTIPEHAFCFNFYRTFFRPQYGFFLTQEHEFCFYFNGTFFGSQPGFFYCNRA